MVFRRLLVGAAAAGALALFVGLVSSGTLALATDQAQGDIEPALVSGIPASAAGTIVPPLSRAAAVAQVRKLTGAFPRIDRIDAKLTTWGEWSRLQGRATDIAGRSPDRQVWIVGAAGEHLTMIGHGMQLPWGAIVLDAATGEVLAAQGGPSGQPPYYDVLVDLAPR